MLNIEIGDKRFRPGKKNPDHRFGTGTKMSFPGRLNRGGLMGGLVKFGFGGVGLGGSGLGGSGFGGCGDSVRCEHRSQCHAGESQAEIRQKRASRRAFTGGIAAAVCWSRVRWSRVHGARVDGSRFVRCGHERLSLSADRLSELPQSHCD